MSDKNEQFQPPVDEGSSSGNGTPSKNSKADLTGLYVVSVALLLILLAQIIF